MKYIKTKNIIYLTVLCLFIPAVIIGCDLKYSIQKSTNLTVSGSSNFDNNSSINSLNLDIDDIGAEITVIKSNESKIEYNLLNLSNEENPSFEIKDKTLFFKHKIKQHQKSSIEGLYLKIFLNTENQLDNCNININGNFNSSKEIILGNNLNITSTVGSIEIENCLSSNLNISCNTGDIAINGILSGDCKISTNTGSIEIEKCLSNSSIISTTTGGIFIDDEISGNNKISTTTGSIIINKFSASNCDINANIGDVKINSLNPLNNYNYDIATTVGSIYIDDKIQKEGLGNHIKNNDPSKDSLNIFVNTGSIEFNTK